VIVSGPDLKHGMAALEVQSGSRGLLLFHDTVPNGRLKQGVALVDLLVRGPKS
jgi:hypothetical protein